MTSAPIPMVSVLMSVYNDERFVGLAIESILTQTLNDFEFIIINDGSTDGTAAILAKYAAQDRRIKVYQQANAGTTAATNFGLSMARGKYVARLDSDDISHPHRLQTELGFLEKNSGIALVGGGSEIIDAGGRIIGVRNIETSCPARTLLHRCIYQQSDVMFRTDVVIKLCGYREKFRNAQDYDLWLRISEVAEIAKLNAILGQWRLNGGGYTLSRTMEQKSEVKVIKQFARQRRATGQDGYASYLPPEAMKHRCNIEPGQYEWVIALVLLQSLRLQEAREIIKELRQGHARGKYIMAYAATCMPEAVISLVLNVRNLYLNTLA
jgi:glycosyltransferase involved in cell wall biosynthesis